MKVFYSVFCLKISISEGSKYLRRCASSSWVHEIVFRPFRFADFSPRNWHSQNSDKDDAGLETGVCRYGSSSPEVVLLETAISHISSSSSQKERISVLTRSMISLCELLTKCSETELEVRLEGTVWRCYPKAVSCFCDIPKTTDMSSF